MEAGGVKKRYAKEHGSILKADSKTIFLFPLEWGGKEFFMKTLKRFAAVAMAGAMMVGSAMTAMAAVSYDGPYFYTYWNADHDASTPDEFAQSPMGDDCVKSFVVEDGIVTMEVGEMSYTIPNVGITVSGSIATATVNGENVVEDTDEDGNAALIVYSQEENAVDMEGGSYVEMELTFDVAGGHSAYTVYIPVIEE